MSLERPQRRRFYIGLMSGTSLDGVDGVLVGWPEGHDGRLDTRAFVHRPFTAELHDELLALNRRGDDELHRAALAANALARDYAAVVDALVDQAQVTRNQIIALGAHGQTLRHRPGEFDGIGYTVQILNGALLAELTGVDVVCDLRSRDLAAGGQGAPLVPAFHAACLGDPTATVAVLNLGGIANLTLLPPRGEVRGFDCGPGNMLLDLWCRRHLGKPYDADGLWAAGGHVDAALLERLLADPFFGRAPPKSTGRDLFDTAWLEARLVGAEDITAQGVMATLAELTPRAAIEALHHEAPGTTRLLVCGGGAFNAHLMRRLAALAGAGVEVASTATAGLPPDQVEALAFAWLAKAHVERRAGNLPAVTGAQGPRLLGALYPA